LRQGCASISIVVLNQTAGAYGDAVIAAIAIVQRITAFANSATLGFGQGFQPVCGFNYGARRFDRVKKAFWFCVNSSLVVMLFLAMAVFIFAPEIIALFRKDDVDVIEIGTRALRFQCFTFPLLGWLIMNNMLIQTMGKAVRASILALNRQGPFLMLFLYLLTSRLGVLGIQLSPPASDAASFLLSIPLFVSILHDLKGGKTKAEPDPLPPHAPDSRTPD
jgi:Na+-driven multidrug efflux pump